MVFTISHDLFLDGHYHLLLQYVSLLPPVLLCVFSPAIMNDKVLPVCLPETDFVVPSGTECYVTGWGATQGTACVFQSGET